ncbi:PREDICTED: probable cysteine--tRNA ligase, mitochondrial [Branchiostoma belcheri]|uniref:cysteine--tRNA ligase n=1 Tax=Branchiostoma belcheri TaxID=7741 RepID=A0A6P4Y765_BRABE|nr:PREDICTED: probable cysteine--tRNA ligase, mitochondrial [Branchiostoma belcheri]
MYMRGCIRTGGVVGGGRRQMLQQRLLKVISGTDGGQDFLKDAVSSVRHCGHHVVGELQESSASQEAVHDPKAWIQPTGHDTGIVVYNSLCRRKVPLILPNKSFASWYQCGPTVYDHAHLGHACCYVKFDIIRRIMEDFFNIDLVMVMGITDIDDKIISKARELNMEFTHVAQTFANEFKRDMGRLRVQPPTVYTRVTNYVPQIITFVQKIVDRGYAYPTESGSVYFDVKKYGDRYGKLVYQSDADLAQFREVDKEKRGFRDFALWKSAKPGEPWWTSPWGKGRGRPGWHIECSTMASAIFGEQLDIHTGGIDLIFPHHENEIAQCEAHHCVPQWANYFLHAGHLHKTMDKDKMSKSLKNTITIREFLEKYTANQFRIFCMMTKYRNVVEYCDTMMNEAVSVQRTLTSFLNNADAYIRGQLECQALDEALLMEKLGETKDKFRRAISDDFDTRAALEAILQLVHATNKQLCKGGQVDNPVRSPGVIAAIQAYVDRVLQLLGVEYPARKKMRMEHSNVQMTDVLDSLVKFRSTVRHYALLKGPDAQPKYGQPQSTAATAAPAPGEGEAGQVKLQRKEREPLMKACDEIRTELVWAGIQIQDRGRKSSWQVLEDQSIEGKQHSLSDPNYSQEQLKKYFVGR